MRAQAHTLEAFVAALILVAGLVFASQATAVTPLSASTSNQHLENQHRAVANDLLAVTAENGSLREAVVHWNETTGFVASSEERAYYTTTPPAENPLSQTLSTFLADRQLAYNVDVRYRSDSGSTGWNTQPMVVMGSPSDNAVSATRTVVLYDSTELGGNETASKTLAEAEDEFYAADIDPDSQVYTVVEVRIVVWRL
ncbi:DUF7288 family protein [Halalkalicoccus jeotgali]|uniref:Uncharacterized protein n=1 Tax=Halalkalicoccus jeotgali (strain DSM 18796 / CECT 7217 / JCM 14584 / KCTC 4019 / B3) TaxID=795797 RepID=D8J4U9_HALJB|nr:hypothetical protein [Halalkalicoccus jeotgali]ADJ15566.1 hypothetical protein HacjB3_10915 [Halalkalicoccus jeotgali B3]ELY36026.1 hypothetical protein C497_11757 [Halalkalicoccus jeotgali B3]